jgi:hypothetical protein
LEAAGFVEVDQVIDLGAADRAGHAEGDALVAMRAWPGEADEAAG